MTTIYKWIIGCTLLAVLSFSGWQYITYRAVSAERQSVALKLLQDGEKLQAKYNALSKEYHIMKSKKEDVHKQLANKEERMLHENQDFYAGECFNADSLQHIREAQSNP